MQLQKHYDVEPTYTSNAIEGNTLTLRETAEVIEHGITIGGKSLRDHLEAVDHYEALLWTPERAAATTPVDESVVNCIAASWLEASPQSLELQPAAATHAALVPQLMEDFGAWLKAAPSDPASVFEAHFRLTAIHPFGDGNGRTARLLMNFLLIRGGYPPISVRPEDRKSYLGALERGSLAEDLLPFQTFMHERLDATLGEYLSALQEALPGA